MKKEKVNKQTGTTKPSRGQAKSMMKATSLFKSMKKAGMKTSKKTSY